MKNCENHQEATPTLDKKISEFFLNNRKIFLSTAIDDKVADDIIQRIIYLDSLSHEDIFLFINSPGGVISSGMAILDVMEAVESNIITIVTGQAASMAAVILACGDKRCAWKKSRVMIHQPLISGSFHGTAIEIETEAKEISRMKEELNTLLSIKTGKSLETVTKDTDRDFWMTSENAKSYGMVDEIQTLI